MPLHPRYIPCNPSEGEGDGSSISVLRTSDNAYFLAAPIPNIQIKDVVTPIPDPQDSASSPPDDDSGLEDESTTTKLASVILPTASLPLSRLLNHPNIISLVDVVQNSQLPGGSIKSGPLADLTIWEDMTAGCLSSLLPSPKTIPPFTDEERWAALVAPDTGRFSLPESLCWHVLRSISRALLWLHHGIKETEGIPGEWGKHDDDWHAVLIMDVSPEQIWFKKPDGAKGVFYGACKLGGFQQAKVCGSVGWKVAISNRPEDVPTWKRAYWAPEINKNIRPWTRASEIWSLGAVLYVMMTGIPPPILYTYDWQISRMNDKDFSHYIRNVVGDMLKTQPGERPTALELVNRVEEKWTEWRTGTEEGRQFVDASDVRVGESLIST
ncbi:uncharacterized protein BP5553_04583 [Venustampulla echinocandica]|uniref:non-specific serine/threonine protein kinase n=1 Tax=Venustampulla echinocandica TaxID=2656787 RepID=A0A370TNP8_9HELO|nr:uncharacterized protein BP5553_04583 [Venustampulla echinocandica]RDL37150.1 hypothetical protein BP5553_04583 [Venustampulla echinocandica]